MSLPGWASTIASATASETLDQGLARIRDLWQSAGPALRVVLEISIVVLAALVVDWLLTRFVKRWADRTSSDLDDRLFAAFHRPLFLTVILVGLWRIVLTLGIADRPRYITLGILGTLLVLQWLGALSRIGSLMVGALSRVERFQLIKPETVPLFDNLLKVGLFGVASYLVIVIWNADVTGWLASAGIVGIAVGFAARDTLANLFAGVFIFADNPYKVGDFVNLDTGERGMVTDIGLRSTRLLTRDDVEITIPNSVIASAKIVNESGGPSPHYRIRTKVGVAYGSDVDQVRQILVDIAAQNPDVRDEPTPRVRFREFGASSLDFELLGWVDDPVLRGRTIDALLTTIYKRFHIEGIEIPYSKQDVYVKELPGRVRQQEPD